MIAFHYLPGNHITNKSLAFSPIHDLSKEILRRVFRLSFFGFTLKNNSSLYREKNELIRQNFKENNKLALIVPSKLLINSSSFPELRGNFRPKHERKEAARRETSTNFPSCACNSSITSLRNDCKVSFGERVRNFSPQISVIWEQQNEIHNFSFVTARVVKYIFIHVLFYLFVYFFNWF